MDLNNMLLSQLSATNNSTNISEKPQKSLTKTKKFDNYFNNYKSKFEKDTTNPNLKNIDKKNTKFVQNSNNYSKENNFNDSPNKKIEIKNTDKDLNQNISDFEEKKQVLQNELKDNNILIDKNILSEISELLSISPEKITMILSELSVSVSMLENTQNLISFLQKAYNFEEPVQILAKDGIKDIMQSIKDIAKNIDYKDNFLNLTEGLNLEQGEKSQNANIIVSTDIKAIEGEIKELLNNLNGKIVKIRTENMEIAEPKFEENNNDFKINIGNNYENSDVEINASIVDENNSNSYLKQNGNGNENNNLLSKDMLNLQNLQNNQFDENSLEDFDFDKITIAETSQTTGLFNATLPKTQALKNINSTEVINQIIEKMKVSIKPDMTEMKILLKPENLGEISLKIATQNGIITAQFTAESQKVKEIIEANFNQLRDLLNEKGLNVSSLEVDISNKDQENFKQFDFNQQSSYTQSDDNLDKSFKIEEETKNEKVDLMDSQVNYSA